MSNTENIEVGVIGARLRYFLPIHLPILRDTEQMTLSDYSQAFSRQYHGRFGWLLVARLHQLRDLEDM